ncbi:hypothetical protein EV127DRAFT_490786 [Xylaria flabelliformis]|nr:hypothetical protein EV127DRAFT_490786 [Xylaria flabelliformis]
MRLTRLDLQNCYCLAGLAFWPVNNIQRVQEFFNHQLHSDGTPYYPLGDRFLFFGSDFLVYQPDDTQTLDFQAQDIFNGRGNLFRIANVPSEYCDGTNLGLTATIQQLVPGPNGGAQDGHTLSSIVLYRYSFTGSSQPNTYQDANALLARRTDLAKAVPKSSTLLFGTGATGFLEDVNEVSKLTTDDIPACVTLARAQGETA